MIPPNRDGGKNNHKTCLHIHINLSLTKDELVILDCPVSLIFPYLSLYDTVWAEQGVCGRRLKRRPGRLTGAKAFSIW